MLEFDKSSILYYYIGFHKQNKVALPLETCRSLSDIDVTAYVNFVVDRGLTMTPGTAVICERRGSHTMRSDECCIRRERK